MNREDCEHKTLFFGSGDYYLFCQHCPAKWATIVDGQDEHGSNYSGKPIGCAPSASGKGVGSQLSGQVRSAPQRDSKP